MTDQTSLRKLCRQQRKSLNDEQQFIHQIQATRILLRSPLIQRAKRIAVFLSTDGELGTHWLIDKLWQQNKEVFLPVLTNFIRHPMRFATYSKQTEMQRNQFGIAEPSVHQRQLISGQQLDAVIMPLTCFDEKGNRIGMGGGFYDRTFAFKRFRQSARPLLIGWAHQCQQVEPLPNQKWDIQLNALVTEKRLYRF